MTDKAWGQVNTIYFNCTAHEQQGYEVSKIPLIGYVVGIILKID